MPAFECYDKNLPVGGSALISFTQDPERYAYTWRLMDFMSSDEAMEIWATKSGYVCPTSAQTPTTVNQDVCLSQFPCCSNYLCWPGGSVGLEIDSIWTNARNAILHDGLDIAEKLAEIEEECNMLLENA